MANTWGELVREGLATGPLSTDQGPYDLSPAIITHDAEQASVLGRPTSWGWTCTRCGQRTLTPRGEPPVAVHCSA